ncbi:MAG: ABC transporter substrate-binding protein [Bacteroidetes bacterium]|nr:ABC transporter substrate-binding protein [Bacteroidota bacterium]
MRKVKFALLFASMVFFFTSCHKHNDCHDKPSSQANLRIGALLSITGSGASTGQSSQAAVQFAQQDINAWLSSINRNARVQITMADTKTDTAEALKQLKLLYGQGIRLFVGPYSSAEVAAIKPFADTHGILIVSPSSVAVSLAIPGDNIFRFVSSDVIQGHAMTAMLIADSIRAIVPIIRDDVWGNDLLGATTKDFYAKGGVISSAVKFSPNTTDFASVLAMADSYVNNLMTTYNSEHIAVYLCALGEGTSILHSAWAYTHLSNVAWYGSSAFAHNASLIADTAACRFAFSHALPCPSFGLDETAIDKWQPLTERIQSSIGRSPEVYALTAYDAVWVGVKTYLAAGTQTDIATLKLAFVDESSNYFGASGNTTLDVNGDRAYGNYDFWAVRQTPAGYIWQISAQYNSATGVLSRLIRK